MAAAALPELPVNNSREAIIENIRTNFGRAPQLRQREWTERPLLIVGGGPSLDDFFPVLRQMRPSADVLAINGAYKYLRLQGIEPEYFLMLDSREENVCHVESPHSETEHILATQVHPRVISALGNYKVTLYNIDSQACHDALPNGEHEFLTAPFGMASVHAVYIAAALGYRRQLLFGYDMSREPDKAYAYQQSPELTDGFLEVDLDGEKYQTTFAMARVAEQFHEAIAPVMNGCNLDIRIMSGGLMPAIMRERQKPHTPESEKLKYEQMWGIEDYRKVSPALEFVEDAVERLSIPEGSLIGDFGCGTGRASRWFMDHGMNAIGVDITETALEELIPFVETPLWDKLPTVDYGFSVDVMEHIPTERVDDVLDRISESCRFGCYLNIDTIPDSFGVRIGKRLHLTVKPAEWWEEKLKARWPSVDMEVDGKQAIFVCRR